MELKRKIIKINMMVKKFIGWTLIVSSLFIWSWLFWPITPKAQTTTLKHGMVLLKQSMNDPALILSSDIDVFLEWSPIMKLGDQSNLRLDFSAKDQSVSTEPTDETDGIFRSYTAELVSKIDLLYFKVAPSNLAGQPLQKNLNNKFTWQLTPVREGKYEGVVWLYLQLFPKNGGVMVTNPLMVFPVDIKVISLFGLRTELLYVLASILLVAGLIILIQIRKTSNIHVVHNDLHS